MSEEKVYACWHKYEEASVHEGIIVKRTAKTVKLRYEGRGGAFGYRNVIPSDDPCLAPTKVEALTRALAKAEQNVEYLESKLGNAKSYIERLLVELKKAKEESNV